MYICIHIFVSISMYTNNIFIICINIYTHTFIALLSHDLDICMYVCMYIHVHTYIYSIYIMYIYIYTYTNIYSFMYRHNVHLYYTYVSATSQSSPGKQFFYINISKIFFLLHTTKYVCVYICICICHLPEQPCALLFPQLNHNKLHSHSVNLVTPATPPLPLPPPPASTSSLPHHHLLHHSTSPAHVQQYQDAKSMRVSARNAKLL